MIFKNIYLLFVLLALQNCTGAYYGIDGPDVISRNDAVAKINDAYLVKFAACGFNSTNVALIVRRFSVSDRKNLDGAYYATKDVDACVNNIHFVNCNDSVTFTCNLSPKDFFGGGGLLQGGF
jgi:small lipoprotein (TIGR04452 family)